MVDYAPGMRTIIRDEEWMIKKIDKNGNVIKVIEVVWETRLCIASASLR